MVWKEILTCPVSILVFREDRDIQRNDPSHTGCPLVALNCWISNTLSEKVWLFPGIIHSCDAAKLRETLVSAESFRNVLFKGSGKMGVPEMCIYTLLMIRLIMLDTFLQNTLPSIRPGQLSGSFSTKIYSFHSHFSSAPFSAFMLEQAQDQFFATSISHLLPHTLSVKLMLGQIWVRVS